MISSNSALKTPTSKGSVDEEEDNCEQLSAEEDPDNGGSWDNSVLSRKYVKQGRPVYKELQRREMIV